MKFPLAFPLLALAFFAGSLPLHAGKITDELEGHLVKLEGNKVKKVEKGSLKDKKVIAFYYSAHWCPPCRQFTPGLAGEYAELSKKYPQFELVFVSSDNSEKEMEEYMKWGNMNYPAIEYKDIDKMKDVAALGARGIPYLVVVDENGKELAGKGGEDWAHPSATLPKLKAILSKSS
jgi:nucleoredoxin